MKQQGKEWYTSAGVSTEYNRVTDYERVSERIGQRIATIATQTEERLIQQKMEIKRLAGEMLSRYQAKNNKIEVKRFTFTTFDKGYKIEVDVPEQHYRVYRATKQDPGHKDYEQVVMDFSLVPLDFAPGSTPKHEEPVKDLFAGNPQKATEHVLDYGKMDDAKEAAEETVKSLERDLPSNKHVGDRGSETQGDL